MKIPTEKQIQPYLDAGIVSRVDRGPLSIYNYTPRATYTSTWDDVTMVCRGLVMDRRDWTCAARSFDKFFNHTDTANTHIPDRYPDVVTVKHDGSLGISFRDPTTGEIRWTTRGSFYSEQAETANRIWREKYAGRVEIHPDITISAEIISPETRVVVCYDFEDLVVLGIRDRHTGADWPFHDVQAWCDDVGMRCAERVSGGYHTLAERAKTLDTQHEGFVLRWGDHRVKVKGSEYFRVSRILQGLEGRSLGDLWYHNGWEEVRELVPEPHLTRVERSMAELDGAAFAAEADVLELLDEHGHKEPRDIVRAVGTDHPLFHLVMHSVRGKTPDYRLHAYRQEFGSKPRDPARKRGEDK